MTQPRLKRRQVHIGNILMWAVMRMSSPNSASEISGLQVCIVNTDAQIDAALDSGDRRAFRVWCLRRASLIARVERVLVEAATTQAA